MHISRINRPSAPIIHLGVLYCEVYLLLEVILLFYLLFSTFCQMPCRIVFSISFNFFCIPHVATFSASTSDCVASSGPCNPIDRLSRQALVELTQQTGQSS